MTTLKKSATSPAKIAKAEREEKAMSLRRQGGTWVQIARRMKELAANGEVQIPPRYDGWSAQKDVERAIARWATDAPKEADLERAVWLERLCEIFAGLYPLAKRGDLFAIDRILNILDREAKLIPGLFPKPGTIGVNVNGTVGLGAVSASGEDDGPVIVTIQWPDVPIDNTLGCAEPGDPATDVEVTKMLIGTFGFKVGNRLAKLVVSELAVIALEVATADAGTATSEKSSNNDVAASISNAMAWG